MESHPNHNHGPGLGNESRLKITLLIVTGIMVLEVIGGLVSGSLALLSDAGHMLIDALALGLSLLAITIAKRPATLARTFGYHRGEIMAALVNGVVLVLLSVSIFYGAYSRLQEPHPVGAAVMLTVAVIGLLANVAGIFLLKTASSSSLNVKAAFWHILGDSVSSVGVIVAGVIIALTGWNTIDPLIAALIGVIIMIGAIGVVRESVDILMENVPRHIKFDKVVETLKSVPGVIDVHDLHIWTITSGVYALSTHLLIEDQRVSKSAEITAAVNKELLERYNLSHTTLQLECARCDNCSDGVVCDIRNPKNHDH